MRIITVRAKPVTSIAVVTKSSIIFVCVFNLVLYVSYFIILIN